MARELIECDIKTKEILNKVTMDEDMNKAGFVCRGKLLEFEGYEGINEMLWLWTKDIDNNKIYTVATLDGGNTHCRVMHSYMYIKELTEL